MKKDNEIALTLVMMIVPIVLCFAVGYTLNLTISGKYPIVWYVIAGGIILLGMSIIILISIFFFERIIVSKIRDQEQIIRLENELNQLKKKE